MSAFNDFHPLRKVAFQVQGPSTTMPETPTNAQQVDQVANNVQNIQKPRTLATNTIAGGIMGGAGSFGMGLAGGGLRAAGKAGLVGAGLGALAGAVSHMFSPSSGNAAM